MPIYRLATVGFTIVLALLGTIEDGIITISSLQDDQSDHGVPRVPLALAGGSGVTGTVSITAITYIANMITGDEYRVPPADKPRAGESMRPPERGERNRSYNDIFFPKRI